MANIGSKNYNFLQDKFVQTTNDVPGMNAMSWSPRQNFEISFHISTYRCTYPRSRPRIKNCFTIEPCTCVYLDFPFTYYVTMSNYYAYHVSHYGLLCHALGIRCHAIHG